MELFLFIILCAAGLYLLFKGAGLLVSGSSSLADRFKINPMVIGLTVVAFGTSTPELTVSLTSAISGNTEVALGNIIGSNIANILLILGLSAVVCPLAVHKNTVWKEIPMSFLGALALFVLALGETIDKGNFSQIQFYGNEQIGIVTPSNGIILLFFFVIFIYYTFGIAKVNAAYKPVILSHGATTSLFLIVVGLLTLVLGSKLLVDNGIAIARLIGASDTFIGLTLVALGTSLPELFTSFVAALNKKVDIAVGNVVGSNIFNIFLVLGATSIARPIPLHATHMADVSVLFASTILLFGSLFVMKKHTIGKIEGSFMIFSYALYMVFLVARG